MTRNLIAISDQHCGSQLGLCPPDGVRLDEGGVYKPVRIEIDPCINRLKYFYDGLLIWETTSSGHAPTMIRAIFQMDNRIGDWDVDDYVVTRGAACPAGTCGDSLIQYPEVCDTDGSFECPTGFCRPLGDPNECTCMPIGACCDTIAHTCTENVLESACLGDLTPLTRCPCAECDGQSQ